MCGCVCVCGCVWVCVGARVCVDRCVWACVGACVCVCGCVDVCVWVCVGVCCVWSGPSYELSVSLEPDLKVDRTIFLHCGGQWGALLGWGWIEAPRCHRPGVR